MSQPILSAIDAINVEIATHEAAIEKLVLARKALGNLLTVDDTVGGTEGHVPAPSAPKQVKKGNDKPTAQSTRRSSAKVELEPGKMTPSEAGMALAESIIKQASARSGDAPKGRKSTRRSQDRPTPEAKKALSSLREQRVENLAKARKAKADKQKGNGDSPNRREQIIALLEEGLSPREIGNELGIAPNYVYHVKRSL